MPIRKCVECAQMHMWNVPCCLQSIQWFLSCKENWLPPTMLLNTGWQPSSLDLLSLFNLRLLSAPAVE